MNVDYCKLCLHERVDEVILQDEQHLCLCLSMIRAFIQTKTAVGKKFNMDGMNYTSF